MIELIESHIRQSIDTKTALLSSLPDIDAAARVLTNTFRNQGKVLFCGNGGSAADAQHIATEFLIRYKSGHERSSLPAISLAADSSAITACGNDYGFDKLFARQIEGLGQKGDCVVGISTSGNSGNIIEAFRMARKKNMYTVLLTGQTGGNSMKPENSDLIDSAVLVPSSETARIQECHIMIGQIFCAVVEKELFNLGS